MSYSCSQSMNQQSHSLFQSNGWDNDVDDSIKDLQKKMGVTGWIVNRPDKAFEVDLDIDGYQPEEVRITVKGNLLTVTGSHDVKGADGYTYQSRNFTRTYTIPENIMKEQMKSILLGDNRTLRIEAPSRSLQDSSSAVSTALAQRIK